MALYALDCDGNRVRVATERPKVDLDSTPAVGVIGRFAHAATTGAVMEIVVGCEVWTNPAKRADGDGHPLGGVVLETHAGASGMDDEGEIFERPAWYTVYDRYAHPSVRRIEETDLDPAATTVAPNLGLVVRELAEMLAVRKQARGTRKAGSAILSSHELDLCRWIGALGVVIAGGLLERVEVATPRRRDEEGEF